MSRQRNVSSSGIASLGRSSGIRTNSATILRRRVLLSLAIWRLGGAKSVLVVLVAERVSVPTLRRQTEFSRIPLRRENRTIYGGSLQNVIADVPQSIGA